MVMKNIWNVVRGVVEPWRSVMWPTMGYSSIAPERRTEAWIAAVSSLRLNRTWMIWRCQQRYRVWGLTFALRCMNGLQIMPQSMLLFRSAYSPVSQAVHSHSDEQIEDVSETRQPVPLDDPLGVDVLVPGARFSPVERQAGEVGRKGAGAEEEGDEEGEPASTMLGERLGDEGGHEACGFTRDEAEREGQSEVAAGR